MAPPTPSCHPPRPRALWRSLAGREGVRGPLRPRAGARYLQLWATLRAPLIFQPWHPRLPRRPAAPAGGGDAGGGGQFTLISGTLLAALGRRNPQESAAGSGRGGRDGRRCAFRWRGRGRWATLGRHRFPSCECRSSPRSTPPPPPTSCWNKWLR